MLDSLSKPGHYDKRIRPYHEGKFGFPVQIVLKRISIKNWVKIVFGGMAFVSAFKLYRLVQILLKSPSASRSVDR